MQAPILEALQHSFYQNDNKGDYPLAYQLATQWAAETDHFEAHFWVANVLLLQGNIKAATKQIRQADAVITGREGAGALPTLTERFRLACLLERYEHTPNGNNIFIPSVAAEKSRIPGYLKTAPEFLPDVNTPEINLLVRFLNTRQLEWEWRIMRNILQEASFVQDKSQLQQLLQNHFTRCQQLLGAGDSYAGIQAACFCREAGLYQDALQWIQQSAQQAESLGDVIGLANCHLQYGDWYAAPFSSPSVWNFCAKASNMQNTALASSVETPEFQQPDAAQLKEATSAWQTAKEHFQKAGSAKGLAQLNLRQGYLSMLEKDFEKTASHVQQAKKVFEKQADWYDYLLAGMQEWMAKVYLKEHSRYDYLSHEMALAGKRLGTTSLTTGLGVLAGRFCRHLAIREKDQEAALIAYKALRKFHLRHNNHHLAAQHLMDLGKLYEVGGLTETALSYYQFAMNELDRLVETEWNALKDDQYNNTFYARCSMALILADCLNLGITLKNPDLIDRSKNRMQTEHTLLKEAQQKVTGIQANNLQQVDQLIPHSQAMASVLSPLYRAQNLRDNADLKGFEKYWQLAYDHYSQLKTGQYTMLETAILGAKKQWKKAGNTFKEYLKNHLRSQQQMASVYDLMGASGQAEIKQLYYHHYTQGFAGFVRTKQYQDALHYFNLLVENFGQSWWEQEDRPWNSITDCGELMEHLHRFEEAIHYYDLAFEKLEEQRKKLTRDDSKVSFANTGYMHYLYAYSARAAMKNKQPELALLYAERGKSRGLLDLMAQNKLAATKHFLGQGFLSEMRGKNAEMASLRYQLAEAQSKHAEDIHEVGKWMQQLELAEEERWQAEQAILAANPELKSVLNHHAPVHGVKKIREKLDNQSLLIQYLMVGEDLIIWAINHHGLAQTETFQIEDWKIKGEVAKLKKAITQKRDWHQPARQLADWLLEPLADIMEHYPSLMIVAHGVLHLLPFQVLPFKDKPLGTVKIISYLPSANTLFFLEKCKLPPSPFTMAVGNPTGDLEAAAIEAQFVVRQYHDNLSPQGRAIIGEQATEAVVRSEMDEADLLHIATHGHVSDSDPFQSSLAMARGARLTLYEMMSENFDARLVVLSACDTGKGTHTKGDEVLSLTRGLLAGGAHAAVVSQWQVNDISTSLFMGHFHQCLSQGLPPAEAIHQAQRYLFQMTDTEKNQALAEMQLAVEDESVQAIIEKERSQRGALVLNNQEQSRVGYDHPYHWGAFIFVGW